MDYLIALVGREQWKIPPDEVVKRPAHMLGIALAIMQAEAEVDEMRYNKSRKK